VSLALGLAVATVPVLIHVPAMLSLEQDIAERLTKAL